MKNSYRLLLAAASLMGLAACEKMQEKDYDASGACMDEGMHPGTAGYDKCVDEEKSKHALDQQREEFQQQQEERDYWRNQRATY